MRKIKSHRRQIVRERNRDWSLDTKGLMTTGERRFIRGVFIVKTVVMVGLVASYFIPAEHAIVVGIASNMLWLWKT